MKRDFTNSAGTGNHVRLRTIQRVAEVLHAFTPDTPAWKLHDLEAHLGWDKATTHRFLHGLDEIQMLERDQDGSYRIGLLPLQLGAVYSGSTPAWQELNTLVSRIAGRTELTTQLGVLERDGVVVVFSISGSMAINAAAMLGQRLPIHASAMGKAILSALDDADLERVLPTTLEVYTAGTISTREVLIDDVSRVRRDGIARADSEFSEALYALAVPIPAGLIGPFPAAIACAGPPPAIASAARWERAAEELLGAAASIRLRIGPSPAAAGVGP